MIIDINQSAFAVGDKYRITVDGREEYRAAQKLLRLFKQIDLFRLEESDPVLSIVRRGDFYKASYDVIIGSESYWFYGDSFWKPVFCCDMGNDRYDIYGHIGRKYSIFLDGRQIAWWEKNAVNFLSGDHYVITADDDATAAHLIAFCLVIDTWRSDRNDNKLFSFDIGSLLQAKKFDPSWQPNSRK